MVINSLLIITNVCLFVILKQQPKTVARQKALLYTLKMINSNPESYTTGHWIELPKLGKGKEEESIVEY